MANKTEYRQYSEQNKKDPKPNWYMRQALGAISLAGVGMVAYKMRGPTGKLLDSIKERNLESTSVEAYAKYAKDGLSDLNHPRDLQGKIIYSQGKDLPDKVIKSSTVMGIDEINAAMVKHYGENNLTDSSIINSTKRLETSIEAFFSDDLNVHTADRLSQLDIFRKYSYDFTRARRMPETPTTIMLSKLRLESIKEHTMKKFRYIKGMPDFDSSDPVVNEDPFANRGKIAEYHKFMMENDQQYAKSYRRTLNSTIKNLNSTIGSRLASDPRMDSKVTDDVNDTSYKPNSKLMSKKYGSTQDLINTFSDTTVSTTGKGSLLYRGSNEEFISNQVVDKFVSMSLNKRELKIKYDKYVPQLNKIGLKLEELKTMHPDDIVDVYIEDAAHNISNKVNRSYINIGIELQDGKKVVIPVPIAEAGIVPNIRGIGRRVHANVNYIVGSPFKNEAATTINSTQRYLEEVYRILSSSKMHDLWDEKNPAGFERSVIKRLGDMQERETPLEGEFRDFFRSKQYRVLHHEQMFNSTTGSVKSRLDDLKVARRGLTMMKKLKRAPKDYMVLALDLETLNIDVPSPQYHPTDARTKIWQYGMVEMDGHGNVMDARDVTSNHIFKEEDILTNENVNNGELRGIYEENTKRGRRLRKFAGYTKKTMGVDDGYESLLAYKRFIDRKSGQSSQYINDRTNPIRNTKDFAGLIKRDVEAFRTKARKAGKQPIIVTANGQRFDLALLGNILGDQSITKWGDSVDIQSVSRLMTLGYHDAPALSVNNMLSHFMSKRGIGGKGLQSFEQDPWGMMDAMSGGGVVRNGLSSVTSLKLMLQGKLGIKDIKAHNSASMDSVATLGIFNLMKDFHMDDSYSILKQVDNYIHKSENMNVEDNVKTFLNLEGLRVGDVHLSFGLMPSNSAAKQILSGVNISHMYPFLGLSPGNTDIHQVDRNMFVKSNSKNKQTAKWRMLNPFQSVNQINQKEWMHKHATWDMNQYTNQLQLNTFSSIGKLGGSPGFIGITDDVMETTTASLHKMISLEDIPANSQLNNELVSMYSKVMNRAKRLAKMRGEPLNTAGGEVTAATWAEASIQIRRRMEAHNNAPVVDGNNPIKVWVEEGGEKRRISISLPGKVKSLTQDVSPGSDKGSAKFLAEVLFEAKGQNLEGIAANHLGTKTIVSRLGIKATDVAGGRWGMQGNIEMFMNWDFLSKKYWGPLKESMLKKAVGLNLWRMDSKNPGYDIRSAREAETSLKYIVNKMNEQIPTTYDKGIVKFGWAGFSKDPKDIIKAVSNITFEEIFKMASTVGHEYTWNQKTLEMYYGFRGQGDITRGRTKIKAEVDLMLKNKTSSSAKQIESIRLSKEQETLIKHMDPLAFLEKKLRGDGTLKEGSIEDYWKARTDTQKATLLEQARIPILIQMGPDQTNILNQGTLGFWGFGQSSTLYGLGHGKENVTNTLVKFQRSYFDQIMINDNHFSPGFKNMLAASTGVAKRPKWAHVANKYVKTIRTIVNNDLSEIMTKKQGISLEEVDSILGRHETIEAIKRDIQRIESKGDDVIVDKIGQSLSDIADLTSKLDNPQEFDAAREMLDNINIKNSKQRLESIKDNDNFLHINDVRKIARIAKDNIIYLPKQVRKFTGEKFELFGDTFDFILEDEIGKLSSNTKRDPVNAKAFVSTLRKIKEATIKEGFDPKKHLFDINLNKATGKHTVSMAGFMVPADAYAENIAHHLGDGEPYMIKADSTKLATDVASAYKKFADEVMGARDEYRLKTKSSNLALAWIKSWGYGMGVDKNSPWFKATGTNYLDGFQATFHSADTIIAEARDMLDHFEDGGNIKLKRMLAGVSKNKHAGIKTVLSNIADMKINTVLGMSDTLFKGDRVANLASGGSVSLGNMFDNAKGELVNLIDNIKMGRTTMPGGAFLRNPVPAAGKHAGFLTDFLGVPEEFSPLLGIDKNQVYMSEALANTIHADNDIDTTHVMMRGFSTIKEHEALAAEDLASLNSILNDGSVSKKFLDDFDAAQYRAGTFMKGGVSYTRIAKVDRREGRGTIIYENRKTDEVDWVVTKGDKLTGPLAPFASKEFSNVASLKHYGKGSTKAMERHIGTISLNAYSKTIIGLWSNTMRTRIHEMYQANPGLAKNSTAIFEMLGSLDHGMAGLMQTAIKFAKKGDVEKVYEMAEFLKVWQNPGKVNAEQYKAARNNWIENTPEIMKDKAGDSFDFILNNAARLSIAKKYDNNAAKFLKHEASNLIGKKDFDFMSMIEYHMQEKGLIDDRLDDRFVSAMEQYHGQALAKFRGEDVPLRMNQFVSNLLGEQEDPLTRALNKRYGDTVAKVMPKFKSMGKFAGIGALAYLGLNFFRPNQLSGGATDAFIDLGTDINDVNSISSDLQLQRKFPLDMVNASFSKEAFIEMNNTGNSAKKGKSNYINALLKENVMRNNYVSFKSRGNQRTSYMSLKSDFGKFNSSDYQRRSGILS